jgi:hypothetical protein
MSDQASMQRVADRLSDLARAKEVVELLVKENILEAAIAATWFESSTEGL